MSLAKVIPLRAGPRLLALKGFQQRASDTVADVIRDTADKIHIDPPRRRQIALAQGVTLLRSPTGSGKTLTIGRTIERLVGGLPRPTVWFWFAPYSGLVVQTRDALTAECPGVRVRDLKTDRSPSQARDGDIFVATWASVAAATKDAKLARQDGEEIPSIDSAIVALRAEGWLVGVVVDEAHVNFGSSAKQAAAFYLDVLRPDFTLLATATPKDDQLVAFEKATGIGQINRIEVSREDVVQSCLNKIGVKAIHFRADTRDEKVLDMDEVAIYAGLQRHNEIKRALQEAGIKLVPLMLIQVENEDKKKLEAEGRPEPINRVRTLLREYGVPADRIAVHHSGEPDPFFHTLAYDEEKEFLVFKMAAATGFDAPRAWTLVSLRQTVSAEFGLQVLGRIMRVHARVQHLHPYASRPPRQTAGILDYGYVFLAAGQNQGGLTEAARQLQALRDSISTVTDNITVLEVGDRAAVQLDARDGFLPLLQSPEGQPTATGRTPEPVGQGGDEAGERGVDPQPSGASPALRSAALRIQHALDIVPPTPDERVANTPGEFRLAPGPTRPGMLPGMVPYPLRTDITIPRRLAREVMPKTVDGLLACMVQRLKIDDGAVALVNKTRGKVLITEEDVFGGSRTTDRMNVPLSAARIALESQAAFSFNDHIDVRELKPALVERLRRELEERGIDPLSDRDLRRAVDLLAMSRPNLLKEACRSCLAGAVEIRQNEEIPDPLIAPPGLEVSAKSVYGVYPPDMNNEELAFARLLDEDQTGSVQWWLRNSENTRWAVSIVLPNGKLHYPDFVIGVDTRRKSEDHIGLVEVKDDGSTGRLFSKVNADKVRGEHSRYGSALMVFRDQSKDWYRVVYRNDLQMLAAGSAFKIEDLVWAQG